MDKKVIVINGSAGVGKNTFVDKMMQYSKVSYMSSVDCIKDIATLCDWDGSKSDKDRKFLSDLKKLVSNYSDLPFKEIQQEVDWLKSKSMSNALIIDIREPKDIERAKKKFNAITLLIKNDRVGINSSNNSDSEVLNYPYDYVIENNGTIEELNKKAFEFCKELNIAHSHYG